MPKVTDYHTFIRRLLTAEAKGTLPVGSVRVNINTNHHQIEVSPGPYQALISANRGDHRGVHLPTWNGMADWVNRQMGGTKTKPAEPDRTLYDRTIHRPAERHGKEYFDIIADQYELPDGYTVTIRRAAPHEHGAFKPYIGDRRRGGLPLTVGSTLPWWCGVCHTQLNRTAIKALDLPTVAA